MNESTAETELPNMPAQGVMFDTSKMLPKRVDTFTVKVNGARVEVGRELAQQIAEHGARVTFKGSGRSIDFTGKTARSDGSFELTLVVEADALTIEHVYPAEPWAVDDAGPED